MICISNAAIDPVTQLSLIVKRLLLPIKKSFISQGEPGCIPTWRVKTFTRVSSRVCGYCGYSLHHHTGATSLVLMRISLGAEAVILWSHDPWHTVPLCWESKETFFFLNQCHFFFSTSFIPSSTLSRGHFVLFRAETPLQEARVEYWSAVKRHIAWCFRAAPSLPCACQATYSIVWVRRSRVTHW